MDFAGVQLLLQGHPIAAVRYEGERAVRLLAAAWQYDIVPTLQGDVTYIGGGVLTFWRLLWWQRLVWSGISAEAAPQR